MFISVQQASEGQEDLHAFKIGRTFVYKYFISYN